MKKLTLFVFVLILLVGCTPSKNNTIKIGAILPLTGDAAAWGIPPKNGAILAIEQINAKGGINGKKLELIIEDDGCDPTKGVAAANKLIANDKPIAIIGAVCSGSTLAIAPLMERSKTVLISPASTHPDITFAGDYIFRDIPSDKYRAQVFAEYVFTQGFKTAGIIYINNQPGKSAEQDFTKYFKQQGADVIISESYMSDASDVKTQLIKIKQKHPDILLSISQVNDAIFVLKNARELNLQIPLYFLSEAIDDPSVIKNAGNATEGVIYITFAKSENKAYDEFAAKYYEKFDTKPETFAPEAYDAVMIISQILRSNLNITSVGLKDKLYLVNKYQGVSGMISFDSNGDVIKPLEIKKIINGSAKSVSIK